jgi:hypothetical protein
MTVTNLKCVHEEIKNSGKLTGWLSKYELVKRDSAPWSLLISTAEVM